MKKAFAILMALALLGFGGWRVWLVLFPGDEAEIRAMLTELEEAAAFKPSDKPLTHMANAGEFSGFFTDQVEISAKGTGGGIRRIVGKTSLQQAAISAQAMGGGFSVSFKDVLVKLGEEKGTATCRLTALARGAGEPTPWVQILDMEIVELDGDWKVAKVAAVEALERIQ